MIQAGQLRATAINPRLYLTEERELERAKSRPGPGRPRRSAPIRFGPPQADLALRRQFKLYERLSLQARADFFNIFNHPNFGPPTNYMTSPLSGQATQMLGASLGAGGQTGASTRSIKSAGRSQRRQ